MVFTCDICGATFPKNQGLLAHQRRKKPCNEQETKITILCGACRRSYSRQDSLMRHLRQGCKGDQTARVDNERLQNLEEQVKELSRMAKLTMGLPAPVTNNTIIGSMNVTNLTIAPWGTPLQLTDADVEAALASIPGVAGTLALPEVVAALMEPTARVLP